MDVEPKKGDNAALLAARLHSGPCKGNGHIYRHGVLFLVVPPLGSPCHHCGGQSGRGRPAEEVPAQVAETSTVPAAGAKGCRHNGI